MLSYLYMFYLKQYITTFKTQVVIQMFEGESRK